MQFAFTAKIVRRFGQFVLRVLPITILGVHAAGCDLPKSKIGVTLGGSAVGACTSTDCETSFESDADLSPSAVDANGVMQVSEGQSTVNAVVMPANSTLIIKGYAIVSSTATCLAQEPISNLTPPAIKDVYAMGEGRWNICVAVVRDGKRQLLRSPEIIVDTTAPAVSGAISVAGDNTLTPTLSWAGASDNYAAASEISYQVRVSTSSMGSISDALTLGDYREVPVGSATLQMSDLVGGTTYYAVVIATDRAGNARMMSQTSFLTGPAGVVAAPSFSVAAGAYGPTQSVVLSSATSGAAIYYAVDGSTPTSLSSSYTTAISVAATQTIKAIAIKANYSDSSVSSAAYTINGSVATPTFSGVTPGTYRTSQSVVIATSTAGAAIYYTVNGVTTPSSATPPSLLYTGPVSVSSTQTIKAIAIKSGFTDSGVLSGTFTVDTTAPTAPSVSGTTPTSSTTPTWTWTSGGGDGNANYRYKLDSSDFSSGATTTTSTTYTSGSVLSAAAHTLYVQERDDAGNWSTSGSFAITINATGDSWSATNTSSAPVARYDHTAVWTGSRMIVWGGNGSVLDELNDGGQYDPVANSWTPTTTFNAPAARRQTDSVWTGSKMIVWGGATRAGAPFNDGGQYDPVANSWTATNTVNAPAARAYHTVVWTGSKMIVWGALNLNSGGLYDPVANSWTATNTAGAPSARYYHTAVWTGSKMIVWGGTSSAGYLNTGVQYDPAANSWSTITTTGAPAVGRYSHIAVWTGSKMIVWGGQGASGGYSLNDGGQYDPAADSWSGVTATAAPAARYYIHNAVVWTGSKMIVWGGYSDSGFLNTGGQYDPVANSWTATGSTGAPSARYLHTTVWTGSKMIAWGGVGSSTSNTGGVYALRADPPANSWSPTTTTGAPDGRYSHTVVWTGSKMIAWGGYSGSGELNNGGQYDPVANSWSATSTTGAPAARRFHTAVWTGSKMIIWGGYGASVSLNTGGRYDPIADSWSATDTFGAPAIRNLHVAVWTGSKMIVWGGRNLSDTDLLNTGGQYDPVANS